MLPLKGPTLVTCTKKHTNERTRTDTHTQNFMMLRWGLREINNVNMSIFPSGLSQSEAPNE